jgi:hypothetical protein
MKVLALAMGQGFAAVASSLTLERGHAAVQQRCPRGLCWQATVPASVNGCLRLCLRLATPALCQTSEAVAFRSRRQEALPCVVLVAAGSGCYRHHVALPKAKGGGCSGNLLELQHRRGCADPAGLAQLPQAGGVLLAAPDVIHQTALRQQTPQAEPKHC